MPERPSGNKRAILRLARLVHLQALHPLAPERRKALIDEARAARTAHPPIHPQGDRN
jgi:hypothetical protein